MFSKDDFFKPFLVSCACVPSWSCNSHYSFSVLIPVLSNCGFSVLIPVLSNCEESCFDCVFEKAKMNRVYNLDCITIVGPHSVP